APVKQPKLQTTKQEFGREEPGIEFGDTREAIPQQPIRKEATVGRNEPCPCGSGKKYKNCHGANL
ncbi:SEC-C metal-binding domain-containing protein, partial [Pedobacter sp. UBA5917]|uniref:SEC-C metal-binding domain-containing protein n=1 Tax=Pedobacter sp. UBA5917 TaxID=1947061 RepID=UPI0025EE54C4